MFKEIKHKKWNPGSLNGSFEYMAWHDMTCLVRRECCMCFCLVIIKLFWLIRTFSHFSMSTGRYFIFIVAVFYNQQFIEETHTCPKWFYIITNRTKHSNVNNFFLLILARVKSHIIEFNNNRPRIKISPYQRLFFYWLEKEPKRYST